MHGKIGTHQGILAQAVEESEVVVRLSLLSEMCVSDERGEFSDSLVALPCCRCHDTGTVDSFMYGYVPDEGVVCPNAAFPEVRADPYFPRQVVCICELVIQFTEGYYAPTPYFSQDLLN